MPLTAFRIDAAERLLRLALHQGGGDAPRHPAATRSADARQQAQHVVLGNRDPGGECRQADVDHLGIGPHQVRQQARHQCAAHRREERIFAAGRTGCCRFVVDPRHHAANVQLGLGVGDVDPGQHVEPRSRRLGVILAGDADVHDLFALLPQRTVQHRPELDRRVEDHAAAGPGQHRRHRGGGLEAARPGEDQTVPATLGARVDQQRRLAAHAPGGLVARIEPHPGNAAVLIDAISLADDDAAIDGVRSAEQISRIGDRPPSRMAVVVGHAAFDGPHRAARPRCQSAPAAVA